MTNFLIIAAIVVVVAGLAYTHKLSKNNVSSGANQKNKPTNKK